MGRGREQLGSMVQTTSRSCLMNSLTGPLLWQVGASISELTSNYAILHTAVEYGCRAEIIDLVLRVAPQASSQLSDDGRIAT